MWVFLLGSISMASPIGDPFPHPDHGRVVMSLFGDTEYVSTRDQDCGDASACNALYSASMGGIEGQWVPREGLGFGVGLGYQAVRIPEANFRGDGVYYTLLLRGALPVSERWWLGGTARWAGSSTTGAIESGGVTETSQQGNGSLSALMGWSEINEGPAVWAGAQASLLWRQTVSPLGEDDPLSIDLRPRYPVAAVAGLSLRSRPVGIPWENSARITFGLEGRIGQSSGVGSSVSLAW